MSFRQLEQPKRSLRTSPSHVPQRQPASLGQLPAAPLLHLASRSPTSLTPAEVLQLHRTLGNRAVGQLVRCAVSSCQASAPAAPHLGMTVQAKLMVGPVGDECEQEADRVAQEVVQGLDTAAPPPAGQVVQRQEEEDEELAQMRPAAAIQRMPGVGGGTVSPDMETAIHQARGGGQPLPEMLRGRMEQAFGANFSGVRIHADAQSDALNRALAAKAFTTGQDVFFRQGAYSLASRSGQAVLAHELSHVVQQGGTAISPSDPLASHAIAAARIVQRKVGPKGDGKTVKHNESGRTYIARQQQNNRH